jgi:hypothetical protein
MMFLLCNQGSLQFSGKMTSRRKFMYLVRNLLQCQFIDFFCGLLSSGAEIRSVCTEAGMFAIRARRKVATEKDFLEAVNKVIKSYAKFSATPRYMTYNWVFHFLVKFQRVIINICSWYIICCLVLFLCILSADEIGCHHCIHCVMKY